MSSMTKPSSLDDWKARKRHTVTLPSGASVEIELPNLALLIKTGQLPNTLLEQALSMQSAPQVTREMIEEQWDFYRYLVSITVKEPAVPEDAVEQLPVEDIDMVVEFATRQRDMDAAGRHLGGLETLESFRDLRGL